MKTKCGANRVMKSDVGAYDAIKTLRGVERN